MIGKHTFYFSKILSKFLVMFFLGYLLFLLINHFVNLNNFYDKKGISSYESIVDAVAEEYGLSNLKESGKIILVIDSFDEDDDSSWHGNMVLNTLIRNINSNYKNNKMFVDYVAIPLQLHKEFNETTISLKNKQITVNTYLFVKTLKEKFPTKKIGINQSYVFGNVVSDIYLSKQLTDLSITVSVAAGNFETLSIFKNSISEISENYMMKFVAFSKQLFFFTCMKNYIDSKYFKFNLNYLEDNRNLYKENTSLDINEIYLSSEKEMDNNLLLFAKIYPEFFLLAKTLSSSSSTPIGLNYLLFHIN